MIKNKGLDILIFLVLSFLFIESISTFNFSHADSGFDTGYSSGSSGGYSGGYSGGSYDYDSGRVSSHSGIGGPMGALFYAIIFLVIVATFIFRAVKKHQIDKEVDRQMTDRRKFDSITDEQIKEIDDNFDLKILTSIAKSAYEKYAKNISNTSKLKSIFTNELIEKYSFDSKRIIENIEFIDLKIIDFKKEKNVEFKAYYIVKCNDYTDESKKEKIVYNKIIFTITNIGELWLIKDIED